LLIVAFLRPSLTDGQRFEPRLFRSGAFQRQMLTRPNAHRTKAMAAFAALKLNGGS
jgi:hypothetical protein